MIIIHRDEVDKRDRKLLKIKNLLGLFCVYLFHPCEYFLPYPLQYFLTALPSSASM